MFAKKLITKHFFVWLASNGAPYLDVNCRSYFLEAWNNLTKPPIYFIDQWNVYGAFNEAPYTAKIIPLAQTATQLTVMMDKIQEMTLLLCAVSQSYHHFSHWMAAVPLQLENPHTNTLLAILIIEVSEMKPVASNSPNQHIPWILP